MRISRNTRPSPAWTVPTTLGESRTSDVLEQGGFMFKKVAASKIAINFLVMPVRSEPKLN
jgi:hypothetical protein